MKLASLTAHANFQEKLVVASLSLAKENSKTSETMLKSFKLLQLPLSLTLNGLLNVRQSAAPAMLVNTHQLLLLIETDTMTSPDLSLLLKLSNS